MSTSHVTTARPKPVIPVILLCALPASGKSESRKYLRSLSAQDCLDNFCIGETVQLDDYPYVEMMRLIDRELEKMKQPRQFFWGEYYSFKDPFDWGTLIHLINEDYEDVVNNHKVHPIAPTRWMMARFDSARRAVGRCPVFCNFGEEIIVKLCAHFDPFIQKFIDKDKNNFPSSLDGKTVVIEFARGGGCGFDRYSDFFPLPEPFGYKYSLGLLSPAILSVCAMLYIWVTPEQSFEKNLARAPPPGYTGPTDLFHAVPECVMKYDYGCDDLEYLLKVSDRPNTILIDHLGQKFYVPVGRFDNRKDLTTFAREDTPKWKPSDVAAIRAAMIAAFCGLLTQWKALHKIQ